jgi:hypothetical protein
VGGNRQVIGLAESRVGVPFEAHAHVYRDTKPLPRSTVLDMPLRDSAKTSVAVTLGIHSHVGRDSYFLAGLPIPVTKDRVADVGMIFWFMKAW